MPTIFNKKRFYVIAIGLIVTTLGSKLILTRQNRNYWSNKQQFLAQPVVAIAEDPTDTRNNFLLAADLIDRQQGEEALAKLQGLEREYPLMAAYVLLSKGKAYQLEQQEQKAEATWQELLREYPTSGASAEALYLLGESNPAYWQQAIAQFPFHPRTIEIIRQRLSQNPNQPKLMAILVKYTPDDPGVDEMRDRLVKEYASQLTPEEWEAIADSYWLKWDYGKAGRAYAKAPITSRNLYRAGRGYHLGNDKTTAKQYYLKLIQQYPEDDYTGWALRRIATLGSKQEGVTYLDLAIAYPKHAPEALVEKAKLLEALNSPESAKDALQTLLTDYKHSEAAAEYRWDMASKKAKSGDLITAWQWAQPIVTNNPDSAIAPKAGFWVAKWVQELRRPEDASTAYKTVLTRFPRSYYAWRSAVALGWDVGDFTTVRDKVPQVVKASKIIPPGGSPTFQELYKLGLESEAWGAISDRN